LVVPVITRRRAIETLAATAASTLLPGRAFASTPFTNPQPTPSGPIKRSSLLVSGTPDGANGAILPAFTGFSYEKTVMSHEIFRTSNKNLIALCKLLGPQLLRISGDSTDKTVFAPNGHGGKYGQTTPAEVAATAAFVKATGWQCLYAVNLAGSANGTTTPELAADEVACAVQHFGPSLYAVEIGNEPDLFSREGRQYDKAHKPWSLPIFETLWNQYRTAILAKNPNVVIVGPAAGHLADWTIPFIKDQTKAKIALLTDHYYAGHGHSTQKFTIDHLLEPDQLLQSNLQLMRDTQKATGIPFRLAETNSITAGAPGVSDSYASALWGLNHILTCAQGGAQGTNFTSGKAGPYTPIVDDGDSKITEIRPEYYGILFFTLAGIGPLYRTRLAAGSPAIDTYAIKTPTGINIVVINKDTQNLDLTLQLPQTIASANLIALTQQSPGATAPNLAATSGVTIQGATVAIDGTFSPALAYTLPTTGSQATCHVPALSAVLIRTT